MDGLLVLFGALVTLVLSIAGMNGVLFERLESLKDGRAGETIECRHPIVFVSRRVFCAGITRPFPKPWRYRPKCLLPKDASYPRRAAKTAPSRQRPLSARS
jgi:hypothetical protein